MIDVWSRKVVAWDVAEMESADIAADPGAAGLSQGALSPPQGLWRHQSTHQPLILHAGNGNVMRAATLEVRLEVLGVLWSFSRLRVPTTIPTQKPCPHGQVPARPPEPAVCHNEEACEWVAAFVDWYNHQHRHSGIKFVTPHQRHSGTATAICQQRADVYEKARQAHPRRWSRSTRCWRQPEDVWINKPPEEPDPILALPLIAGCLNGSQ